MLPGNAGPRRGASTPVGSRNLQPREPVVLPVDEYDRTGPDFDPAEWEHAGTPRTVLSEFLAEDEDDEPTVRPTAIAAKANPVSPVKTSTRAEREGTSVPADAITGTADGNGSSAHTSDEAITVPITSEEMRSRIKRDGRIVKRMRAADRERLRGIADPAALAGETATTVVCYGAGLRCAVEAKADAHAELYHSPLDEPREVRQARLKDAWAVVTRGRQKIAAYDAWTTAHRPELADDGLLDGLAGSKEDRAAAKARLAELDRTYRTGAGRSGSAAPTTEAVPVPLIYQDEYRGKVRAYPEWVGRVLRMVVARKQARYIPAMAFVLAQLAYWTEPTDGTGRPRARRARVINGKWWVVLGYGQMEKQTPVSRSQARQAVKVLKEHRLVETLAAKGANVGTEAGGVNYGPNTVFLRVNTGALDPLVKEVMSG
ncbi:hypothetical protein [Urbifossiella limnaea]|uniref:Uncharacterized protein n=1 Tax=Urbifossiella limnaea TaxID=2528023 RepID=A0A517XW29_9BACT|nr:hypothetical protein [Urbifossiella limnaea]QDU21711.1 hypothetical protein ETAA1_36840 [Urbifossiella limnaea]